VRTRSTSLTRVAACLLALGVVTGCSGGSSGGTQSAAAVLARAKTVLDQTTSVHFVLTSTSVPSGGIGARVIGGEGVAQRPRDFQGTLKILLGSTAASIEVISVGGKVYIKAPFTTKFALINPEVFHLKDPGGLVDRQAGVTRLLTGMTGVKSLGTARIGDETVHQVRGSVPGSVVADLLTTADPSKPVSVTVAIADQSGQLRRAVLTGPFFRQNTTSTFTIVFDRYGEKVTIDAPSTG